MCNHPLHLVDVFPREKYTGNQLAVVHETRHLSSETMQRIANEMDYSETTFITGTEPTDAGHRVRIFTPQTELPFAGHPVLGTAYVLREHVLDGKTDQVVLDLDVGSIPVTIQEGDDEADRYWMDQQSPSFGDVLSRDRVGDVLRLEPSQFDPAHEPQVVSTGLPTLIVPLQSIEDVRAATIHETAYDELVDEFDVKVVLVFSSETICPANDLHVRVFGPALGVPEDPATGSSNGCLAAYLVHHRYIEGSPLECAVEQGYEIGRPSRLHLKADGTVEDLDIAVGGKVIPVATGVLV